MVSHTVAPLRGEGLDSFVCSTGQAACIFLYCLASRVRANANEREGGFACGMPAGTQTDFYKQGVCPK